MTGSNTCLLRTTILFTLPATSFHAILPQIILNSDSWNSCLVLFFPSLLFLSSTLPHRLTLSALHLFLSSFLSFSYHLFPLSFLSIFYLAFLQLSIPSLSSSTFPPSITFLPSLLYPLPSTFLPYHTCHYFSESLS